jgi:hypothetical protein
MVGDWGLYLFEVVGLHEVGAVGQITLGVGGVVFHRAEDERLFGGVFVEPLPLVVDVQVAPVLKCRLDVAEIFLPPSKILPDPLPLLNVAVIRMTLELLSLFRLLF